MIQDAQRLAADLVQTSRIETDRVRAWYGPAPIGFQRFANSFAAADNNGGVHGAIAVCAAVHWFVPNSPI